MNGLISTGALAAVLGAPDLVLLDASLHLPDANRDAAAEHRAARIPGARFLALDHDLPEAAAFAAWLAALGVGAASRVVVYDDSAIRSAARAWFLLRLAGHAAVAVLDGGLGKWRAEARPLASGDEPAAAPGDFAAARWDARRLRDKAAVRANLARRAEQVIDARGRPRFAGLAPEPRPGVAPGHIPGSANVPYAALFADDGTLRDAAALRATFAAAGVDLTRPIVTSCGSGITACALLLALERLGAADAALYDGSWAEWGADPATPKALGA